MFGTIKEKRGEDDYTKEINMIKKAKCIIFPTNKRILGWNLFVSILLIWTAIAVPVKVSFEDHTKNQPMPELFFDTFVDFCFLCDIVLQFF